MQPSTAALTVCTDARSTAPAAAAAATARGRSGGASRSVPVPAGGSCAPAAAAAAPSAPTGALLRLLEGRLQRLRSPRALNHLPVLAGLPSPLRSSTRPRRLRLRSRDLRDGGAEQGGG
jgi:hypothetical protein